MLQARQTQQVTPNFKPQKPIAERLAEAMIEANAYGGAEREALLAQGFTALDLDMYGTEARVLATQRFVRNIGGGAGDGSEATNGGKKDSTGGAADRFPEAPYLTPAVSHDEATDAEAREAVEATYRAVLLRVPVSDLCQLWSGLRNGGSTPAEATLRVSAAFAPGDGASA